VTLEVDGREVIVTNPDKVFFPKAGYTKLDLVDYYLAVMPGALRGVFRRPMVLKRFVNGAEEEPFFQKRAPQNLPPGITTSRVTFPSGRWADLVVCDEPADLAWAINLGCIDLNPWPVREDDVDHPDELRIDLDPTPEASFTQVKEVALVAKELLDELGYRSYPKTSGSRGIHVNVRIEPKYEFTQVRRAALAIAREVAMRVPDIATANWWKEERHGVFLDYNQNARDRTVASAYSVRPTPDARASCPVSWEELPDVKLGDFTILTVPGRFKAGIDPDAAIDDVYHSLDPLLELVKKHEGMGLGEGAYPPQFPKAAGEPRRVQPSRARKDDDEEPTPPPMHTQRTGPKRFNEADGRLPPRRGKRAQPPSTT
jgi:DNA ligase D-like protein (predicted polymerase)